MLLPKNKLLSDVLLYIKAFLKWLCLSVIIGIICGTVGSFFASAIHFATDFRLQNKWLILLLPVGGIISVGLYKLFRVSGVGTNNVFETVRSEKKVSILLAPAVIIGATLTHLFGGSAGKEGAALQIGGSISSFLGRVLKLDDSSRHILTICGMSALFSAVFGTPIGAAVFAIEVISVGTFCSAAIFPSLLSSLTASFVAEFLNLKPESFEVFSVINVDIKTFVSVVVISIAGAIVSVIFCKSLHLSEKYFKRMFKNEFLRVAVGGTVIIVLTILVGNNDYNGGGIEVIERIFNEGTVRYEAFVLKLIFTVITVASGYKGGEIVPTLFIGANLGAAMSAFLGTNMQFCTAVGMCALFCGVTNCPLATVFLAVELFGLNGLPFYALAVGVSFLLSGNISLYEGQKLSFSKLSDKKIDD